LRDAGNQDQILKGFFGLCGIGRGIFPVVRELERENASLVIGRTQKVVRVRDTLLKGNVPWSVPPPVYRFVRR
jgi:hypothetical protein